MENRYLLLLITLIFGLAEQTTQAMTWMPKSFFKDSKPISLLEKLSLNFLGKKTTIDVGTILDKALEDSKEESFNISFWNEPETADHQPDYDEVLQALEAATTIGIMPPFQEQLNENRIAFIHMLLTHEVMKYHPGLEDKFNWQLENGKRWSIHTETSDTPNTKPSFIVKVPELFVKNPTNIAPFHHEIGHYKNLDINHLITEFKKKKSKNIDDFKKSQEYIPQRKRDEWRADETIINSPAILTRCINAFEQKNSPHLDHLRKELGIRMPDQNSDAEEMFHPPSSERLTRFKERYGKFTKYHSDTHFYNPKVRQFFGAPKITGTSPRKAAKVLGLDQDYYPNLLTDMLIRVDKKKFQNFQPTNLARYSLMYRKNTFKKNEAFII